MNPLPTATALGDMATKGLATDGMVGKRSDNIRAFRHAARHSRHVRVLRVAIPVVIVAMLAAAALAAWLDPLRILAARLPVDSAGLVISGTKITMASPKLSGYTRDARWYELTARGATQDVTKPDIVELQEIRAKLEMQDKSTMDLFALDGTFDRKAGLLVLGRNITLRSTNGLEVRLSQAVIDTVSGNITSDKPVEMKMLQGTLNANTMEVTDRGDVVRFDGGVAMTLTLGDVAAPKAVQP